jgi:hypothetical protein
MIDTDDDANDSEPCFGPIHRQSDYPLGLRWRVPHRALAFPGLPTCRNSRFEDALNGVLTDAVLAAEVGRFVSYSRRPSSYAHQRRYRGNSFTHRCILAAVDGATAAGLLEEERASPGSRGWQSRFKATPLLYEKLVEHPARFQQNESIWLKDHGRKLVSYEDSHDTHRMRTELDAINRAIGSIKISFLGKGIEKQRRCWIMGDAYMLSTPPNLRRIFNRKSFDCGGRAYGPWQGLKSSYRAMMTLDGASVLEPDFVAIHAQLIYAQRDIPLIDDAYTTGEFPREHGKSAFTIALNATSQQGAIRAVADKLMIERDTASRLLKAIIASINRLPMPSALTPASA